MKELNPKWFEYEISFLKSRVEIRKESISREKSEFDMPDELLISVNQAEIDLFNTFIEKLTTIYIAMFDKEPEDCELIITGKISGFNN